MSRRWKLAQRKALQRSRWVDMQCTVENLTSPCLASAWPRHITAAPAQALELKNRSENQMSADRETVARNSAMAKDAALKDDFESQTYLKVTWRQHGGFCRSLAFAILWLTSIGSMSALRNSRCYLTSSCLRWPTVLERVSSSWVTSCSRCRAI